MDTAVYPLLSKEGLGVVAVAREASAHTGQRGVVSVIPAPARGRFAFGGKAGIQGYMLLAVPLIGTCLSLLLNIAPVFAATAPAAQNPGVSPAGKDVLRFLGDTAERAGLTADADADTTDVYDIIAAIINTVLGLTGIIFFIQVFWAGFRWMTAGGAEETITLAKKTITSSAIGIAIALSAFVLTNFVLNRIEEAVRGPVQVDVSSPPAPGTPEPLTEESQTTPTAEDTGWCQVVTLVDPNDESKDIYGDCYQATQQKCNQDIAQTDTGKGRWETIEANCK